MFAKTYDDVSRGSKPIKHGQVWWLLLVCCGIRARKWYKKPIRVSKLSHTGIIYDKYWPKNPKVIFRESLVHSVTPFCCLLWIRRLPTKMTRFMSKTVFRKIFPGWLRVVLLITMYLFLCLVVWGGVYPWSNIDKIETTEMCRCYTAAPSAGMSLSSVSCANWMRINLLEGRRFSSLQIVHFQPICLFLVRFQHINW